MTEIDFDDVGGWGPSLTGVLQALLPANITARLRAASPASDDEALEVVFGLSDAGAIAAATEQWISEGYVIGYHASRLSDVEIESVNRNGIRCLVLHVRMEQLAERLAVHGDWEQVRDRLEPIVREIGEGCRDGQAHLSVSRGSLLRASPHYLRHGSEFDQVVTKELLGTDALSLLRTGRTPVLFRICVPGRSALEVDRRHLGYGQMSGLIRRLLQVWAMWLYDPSIQPGEWRVAYGLIFNQDIPAAWIDCVQQVEEHAEDTG